MIDGAKRRELGKDGLRFTAWEMGTGPLVLLLHGFPDTSQTWRETMPALAEAGYRAVAVTLRGYEPSSQPSAKRAASDFRVANLAQDVLDWIALLGEERAHLVGHDWGATIAFAAARKAPAKVASLSLLAVPHPARLGEQIAGDKAQRKASSYIVFFQLKGIAEFIIRRRDFAYLEGLWRKWSPTWAIPEGDLASMRETFRQPGTLQSALGYYRAAANRKDAPSMELLAGEVEVPTLGLHGVEDGCILPHAFKASMRSEDFPGGMTCKEIAGAGHFLQLEHAEAVNAELIAFLNAQR